MAQRRADGCSSLGSSGVPLAVEAHVKSYGATLQTVSRAQWHQPFLTCCALNGIRGVKDKAPTTRHGTFPRPVDQTSRQFYPISFMSSWRGSSSSRPQRSSGLRRCVIFLPSITDAFTPFTNAEPLLCSQTRLPKRPHGGPPLGAVGSRVS